MTSGRRVLIAGLMVAAVGLVVPAAGPVSAQEDGLILAKAAPAQVLAAEPIVYELNAANVGSVPLYNISFREVLPSGVSYVPGSASPDGAGEPTAITDGAGVTTLIWANLADLQPGSSFALSFSAVPDPDVHPVGSTVANQAEVFAHLDPRLVPRFDAAGVPIPSSFNASASSTPQVTAITALEIEKSEPSPEGELLRGVQTNWTTYSLIVRTTDVDGVADIVVTDYLPAELEFLGCGGVDNSAAPEYPDSGPLGAFTVPDCAPPASVETVEDPPAVGGTVYPPGVYTRVTWNLGSLPGGSEVTINYAAGIPLRANEMFDPDPGPVPDPESLGQAANLDNNTGPSTRELEAEGSITNIARVAGVYGGPVLGGDPALRDVAADDTVTRSIEDVRMRKVALSSTFEFDGVVGFDVIVDVSQYVSASDIVVTDVLPDGLCPLGALPDGVSLPAGCPPGDPSHEPSVPYAAVSLTDGTFEITFEPIDAIDPNGTVTIRYYAGMRTTYGGGASGGMPIVSGDTFANSVSLDAVTTPIDGTGETGEQVVGDTSADTLTTNEVGLDKRMLPRQLSADGDCPVAAASLAGYGEPADDPAAYMFRRGDRVCFRLTVNFAQMIATRNPVVTDFLPASVEYVPGSAVATELNTVDEFDVTDDPVEPTFVIGTTILGERFVEPGDVFDVVLAGVVVDAPIADAPDLLGNLMKLRVENTAGEARSFRDALDFHVAPAAQVSLAKGVFEVDLPESGPHGADVDGVEVREGSQVTYRLDVTNAGDVENGTDYSVRALDVWDILPPQIDCSMVSGITNFLDGDDTDTVHGACFDPGAPGYPLAASDTDSVIRWQFPTIVGDEDRYAIGWQATDNVRTLTYTVTMPSPLSTGLSGTDLSIENRAGVHTFDAATNVSGVAATFTPENNIDPQTGPDDWTAPPAADISWVVTPDTSVDKSLVTSIDESNNDAAGQAVIGELVTYTYAVVVPARTSVFHGVLSDELPLNVSLLASPAPVGRFHPDAADLGAGEALPAGFDLDPDTGTLTFPTAYTNDTDTAQRFEVTVVTVVTGAGLNQVQQVSRTNTARFAAVASAADGAPTLPEQSDTATFQIRQPQPSLAKSDDTPDGVAPGDSLVTYTLAATNATGRPPLHDAFVADCLPAPLQFSEFTTGTPDPTFGPAAGDPATNGCAIGTTYIGFGLGSVVAGTPVERSYVAFVPDTVVGGDVFTNTALLSGGSLDDDQAAPGDAPNPTERIYTAGAANTIEVQGAALVKSVDPDQATIGELVTYTVEVSVPGNQVLYDLAVVDTAPAWLRDFTLVSSSCTLGDDPGEPCDLVADELLGPEEDPSDPGLQVLAFVLGDADPVDDVRNITIVYTAIVDDVDANVAGASLDNSAAARWNGTSAGTPITDPLHPWERGGAPGAAAVVVEEPAVTIAKSVSNAAPEPDETFTYTLEVTNATGTTVSDAHNLVVVDVVPVGVVVDTDTIDPAGDYDPTARTITWTDAGPLAPGASLTFSYQAELAPSAQLETGEALINTARVDAYESLPTGGRLYESDPTSVTVVPQFPILSVTKSVVNAAPVYIGQPVTWRIVVANDGGGSAYDVVVTDTLPPNWTYQPGSSQLAGAVIDDPDIDSSTLTWVLDDLAAAPVVIAPDSSVTIEFVAVPGPDVVDDPEVGSTNPHTNTASATADDASGAPGNATGPYADDGSASTRIDAADLVLTKTGPSEVIAGQSFNWNVVVSNRAAGAGETIDEAVGPFRVVDTLPDGVTHQTSVGVGWECSYDPDAHEVTCDRLDDDETLPSGSQFPPIVLTVAVDSDALPGTEYTNVGTVEGRTYELDPDSNTGDHTTGVAAEADLAVTKNRSGGMAAVAGNPLTYTLDVVNNGPSTSREPITVTDALPDTVDFVGFAGTAADWACTYDPDDHEVTCERGLDLLAGFSAGQIVINVGVQSGATGTLVNTAEVTGTTTDPVPGNNDAEDSTPIVTEADLRLSKSAVDPPFTGGETGTYRFRVDNDGPSDAAADVTIVDTLPDGLAYAGTFTSVEGDWVCAATGAGFDCTLDGSLPADAFAVVDVDVEVDPDLVGDYTNTATVSSPTPDPNEANNTDTESSEITGEADLAIAKSGPATAAAGTSVTWELVVTNAGPSDSVAPITVTDRLPAGVEFVSAEGTGWSCTHDDSVVPELVVCIYGSTLTAPGAGVPTAAPTISIEVDVHPSAGPATLVNRVSVTGTTTDPDPGNNDHTHDLDVFDDVEITIVKSTTGPDPVLAGETTEFEIVVSNAGPSTADSVRVVDTLPDGLVATAASGDGWTCDPATGTVVNCLLAELLPGDSTPITITAAVSSGVPDGTTLTNTATVSTSSPGDDTDDNTATSTVDVETAADLAITKSHDEDVVLAGDDVVFTIEVRNLGPSDAVGPVTVTDTLPDGFRYVTHDGPWSCTDDPPGAPGAEVVCTLDEPANLIAGTAAPALLLHVAVAPDVDASTDPDTYVNVVTVSSETPDPNPDNDEATDPVEIGQMSNVSIAKSHSGPVRVGDDITFELNVRNDGPSEARDVQVTDAVPSALDIVSIEALGWTCADDDGTITCDLDDPLAPGADAPPIEVTVTVTAAAYPSVVNTAEVTTSTPESDTSDNSATDSVTVPALVDLAITKTGPDEFVVGGQGTYTLSVTNLGPTPDPGPITIVDQLPNGLSVASVSPSGDCDVTGRRVDCVLAGPLAVGANRTVTINVDVGAAAAPSVSNTAVVSTPSEEVSTDNNRSTVVTPVIPTSVLDVDKRVVAQSGDVATWDIVVTNRGPSPTSQPIVVTDALPTGLTFVSVSGDGWVCSETSGTVTCTYSGVIAVDGSASIELRTRVTAAPGTTITNSVTVSGGSPNGSTGTSSGTVEALPPVGPGTTVPGTTVPGTVPGSTVPPTTVRPGGVIPATGSSSGVTLSIAVALMACGAFLVLVRRRRTPVNGV